MTHPRVFVYGTLRQGGVRAMPNLFPASIFIGKATVRGWLYDLGAYPGLVLDEMGTVVIGEVYAVTAEILDELDEIEGYQRDNPAASDYLRRLVAVSLGEGRTARCWVYECNPRGFACRTVIPSGDWIAYARTKPAWAQDSGSDEEER